MLPARPVRISARSEQRAVVVHQRPAALQSLGKMQEMHRRRPGRRQHHMLHAKILGQFLLKCLALRPENKIPAPDHFQNPPVNDFTLINAREGDF